MGDDGYEETSSGSDGGDSSDGSEGGHGGGDGAGGGGGGLFERSEDDTHTEGESSLSTTAEESGDTGADARASAADAAALPSPSPTALTGLAEALASALAGIAPGDLAAVGALIDSLVGPGAAPPPWTVTPSGVVIVDDEAGVGAANTAPGGTTGGLKTTAATPAGETGIGPGAEVDPTTGAIETPTGDPRIGTLTEPRGDYVTGRGVPTDEDDVYPPGVTPVTPSGGEPPPIPPAPPGSVAVLGPDGQVHYDYPGESPTYGPDSPPPDTGRAPAGPPKPSPLLGIDPAVGYSPAEVYTSLKAKRGPAEPKPGASFGTSPRATARRVPLNPRATDPETLRKMKFIRDLAPGIIAAARARGVKPRQALFLVALSALETDWGRAYHDGNVFNFQGKGPAGQVIRRMIEADKNPTGQVKIVTDSSGAPVIDPRTGQPKIQLRLQSSPHAVFGSIAEAVNFELDVVFTIFSSSATSLLSNASTTIQEFANQLRTYSSQGTIPTDLPIRYQDVEIAELAVLDDNMSQLKAYLVSLAVQLQSAIDKGDEQEAYALGTFAAAAKAELTDRLEESASIRGVGLSYSTPFGTIKSQP